MSDEEADAVLASPQGRQVAAMMRYTAVGDPAGVREYLGTFAEHASADELIVVHAATTLEARLESVRLVAEVCGLVPSA